MADRIEVNLPSEYTDGSPAKWPRGEYFWAPADTVYHEKLADLGKELIQGSRRDQKYIFKELPRGYRIYHKKRPDGKIDRYIFGHPRSKFDSPNKFSTHFKWLMLGGVGQCECINCKGTTMRKSSLPVMTATTIASDPVVNDFSAQLERFTNYLEEKQDDLNEYTLEWEGTPLWRAHELLDGHSFKTIVAKYGTLPSFVPRKGELVLFYLNEDLNGRFEETTQYFKIINEVYGKSSDFPVWRAGVIAAMPEYQLSHEDLSIRPYNHLEATTKSFRIELYPDPDSRDKSLSNESYLIPLHRIRPLSVFHEFLSGVPQKDWHETIHNALKSMNTACLVDPLQFTGNMFSYSIRCRGIWIGPELYVSGDAVRLMPARGTDINVDQAMVIKHIDLRFENEDVYDERSSIVVAGPVITVNRHRSFQTTELTISSKQGQLLPPSTSGYTWYLTDISSDGDLPDDNNDSILNNWQEVPISYIVGRLYDSEAMKILLNIDNFDVGGLGTKQARRWAKKHRTNMKVNIHQEWILTADRIEALAIEVLNGRPVGRDSESEDFGANNHAHGHWRSKNRGVLGSESGRASIIYNGNGEIDESGEDESRLEKILEASIFNDTLQSDINGHQAQSLESVVTDRIHNWSEDEEGDEKIESSISGVLAGNVLPTREEESNSGIADGALNGLSAEHERPVKRPRL